MSSPNSLLMDKYKILLNLYIFHVDLDDLLDLSLTKIKEELIHVVFHC